MRLKTALLTLALGATSSAFASGFGLDEVKGEGGGWIIHRLVGVTDVLLACASPTAVDECLRVPLGGYIPGTTLDFLYVDPDSGAGWLVAHRPVVGDLIFACYTPLTQPRCAQVAVPRAPPTSTLARIGGVEAGGGGLLGSLPGLKQPAGASDQVLADEGDGPGAAIWVAASFQPLGAVNLYACRSLTRDPECVLAAEDLLLVDREAAGLRRLADIDGGIEVRAVANGSPAQRAGFEGGEVITSVGTTPVHSVAELRGALAQLPAGQPIKLGLRLGGGKYIHLDSRFSSGEGGRDQESEGGGGDRADAVDNGGDEEFVDEGGGLYVEGLDDEARSDDGPSSRGQSRRDPRRGSPRISTPTPPPYSAEHVDSTNAGRIAADLGGLRGLRAFEATMTLEVGSARTQFLLALPEMGFAVSFGQRGRLIIRGQETLIESITDVWKGGSVDVAMKLTDSAILLTVDNAVFGPMPVDMPGSGEVGKWALSIDSDGLAITDLRVVPTSN